LRRKAEEHASDNAGPKMIQVSLALDRLLDTVADVAKDMRDEGTKTIQYSSTLLVGGSFFIAILNLLMSRRRPRAHDEPDTEAHDKPVDQPSPLPVNPSAVHL
jgi:hypothetical protein